MLLNARAETMFGYAPKELVGRPVDMLVPERLRAAHVAHRQGFLQESRPRAMGAGRELFAVRKDGTELPVEVGLNPMQTSEGSFVIASVVDVSARKRPSSMRRASATRWRTSHASPCWANCPARWPTS